MGAVDPAGDGLACQRVVLGVGRGQVGVAEVRVDLAAVVGVHVVTDAAGAVGAEGGQVDGGDDDLLARSCGFRFATLDSLFAEGRHFLPSLR